MYLKALEIQGFKAFPDKTVLQFGEDITAVVGPNGSGKSNISDAIRWVMGEQSAKALRGSKMEDVIFSGTAQRAPVGFAQVTLVLDNTEHIFPSMEESEVAVTRRYYRSGESEYYINRQSVRLKDETIFLNDAFLLFSSASVAIFVTQSPNTHSISYCTSLYDNASFSEK